MYAKRNGEGSGDLTPAQVEILEIVWARKEVTVAEVVEALSATRPIARNTVQTMLSRLHERGWLLCDTADKIHRFSAAMPRKKVMAGLARKLVDTLFKGSSSGLVSALIDAETLTPAEAEKIRVLVANAQKKAR